MSNASSSPAEKPRTWIPVIAAGSIAAVLVVVAAWSAIFGQRLSEVQQDTITACEAAYAQTSGPDIAGGDVFEPPQMREYYTFAETHGEVPVPLAEVSDDVTDEWERAAKQYEDGGGGPVALVWRHADDTYSQCVVNFRGRHIDADSAVLGPLVIAPTE